MKFFVLRAYILIATLISLSPFVSAQDGHLDFNPQEEVQRITATIAALKENSIAELTFNIELRGTAQDFLDNLPAGYLPNMTGQVATFLSCRGQQVIVKKDEIIDLLRGCATLFSGDPAVYMSNSTSMKIASLNRLYKILTAVHENAREMTTQAAEVRAEPKSRPEIDAQRLLRAQDYLEGLENIRIYSRTQTLAKQIRDHATFPHYEQGALSEILIKIGENRVSKDDLFSFITYSTEIVNSQSPDYSGDRHFNLSPEIIALCAQLIQSLHQDIAVQAVATTAGTLKHNQDGTLKTSESIKSLALQITHTFATYLTSLCDADGVSVRGVNFTVQDADVAMMTLRHINQGNLPYSELGQALITLNDILTELCDKTDFHLKYPGTAEALEALTHELVLEVKTQTTASPAAAKPREKEEKNPDTVRPGAVRPDAVRIDPDDMTRATRGRGPRTPYGEVRGPDISHFDVQVGPDGTLVFAPPSLGDMIRDLLPTAAQRGLRAENIDRDRGAFDVGKNSDRGNKDIVDRVIRWIRGRKMFGHVRSK